MKTFRRIALALVLSFTMLAVNAQSYQKVAAHYATVKGATAKVTLVQHKSALKTAKTATGTAVMSRPDKVSISVNGGKDQLIMDGTTFTMVSRGHKRTTDSRKNAQFATFHQVFVNLLSGGHSGGNIDNLPGVSIKNEGQTMAITVVPTKAKHMMFSSFVLILDSRTSALRSLRMNQKGSNYLEYLFTDFTWKK